MQLEKVNGRVGTALVMFLVFATMTLLALGFPEKARLMPLLVGIPGTLLALFQLVVELRAPRTDKDEGLGPAERRMLGWTLVFFAGLFIMVGALVHVGVIEQLGELATSAVGDHYLAASAGMLFGSAALSAIVDNIPYVATMAPLVAGIVASFGLTRLLQAQLFNVRPTDPLTLSAVTAFIALVAMLACVIPARRATRVDPMITLRSE